MKKQFEILIMILVVMVSILYGYENVVQAEENKDTPQDTFYVSNSKQLMAALDSISISDQPDMVCNIILTNDVKATGEIDLSCQTTIDLNGYILTMPDNKGLFIKEKAKVVIKSSDKGGTIILKYTKYGNGIYNLGNFTMNSGKIKLSASKATLINNQPEGSVSINGGTLQFLGDKSVKESMVCTQAGISSQGVLTMTGGTLTMSGGNTYRVGIYAFENGKVYIKGGTIDVKGIYGRGIYNEGNVTMSKGKILSGGFGVCQRQTFHMTGGSIKSVKSDAIFVGNGIKTIIDGGTVESKSGCGIFTGSGKALPIIKKGTVKGTKAVGNGNGYSYYIRDTKGKKILCKSRMLKY